jgi:hypothetical protein
MWLGGCGGGLGGAGGIAFMEVGCQPPARTIYTFDILSTIITISPKRNLAEYVSFLTKYVMSLLSVAVLAVLWLDVLRLKLLARAPLPSSWWASMTAAHHCLCKCHANRCELSIARLCKTGFKSCTNDAQKRFEILLWLSPLCLVVTNPSISRAPLLMSEIQDALKISVGRTGDNQQALSIVRVDALGDAVPATNSNVLGVLILV